MGSIYNIVRWGDTIPTTPFSWLVCVLFWGVFFSFVLRRAFSNSSLFFLQLFLAPLCYLLFLKIMNDWLPHLDPRGVWESYNDAYNHGIPGGYIDSPMKNAFYHWLRMPAHRCYELPFIATFTSVLIVVATKALEYILMYFYQRNELSALQRALILFFVIIPTLLVIGAALAFVAFVIVVVPLVLIACAAAFAMVPNKPRY